MQPMSANVCCLYEHGLVFIALGIKFKQENLHAKRMQHDSFKLQVVFHLLIVPA